MSPSVRLMIFVGASFGFLSVAFGAFGAHALKGILSPYGKGIYATAVDYQMFHAMAILFLALWSQNVSPTIQKNVQRVFLCFVFGVLIFCGSLYLLAISEIKWLGAITPIGGVGFLVGWGLLITIGLRYKTTP